MYTAPCLYNANVNILLYIILGDYMYTTPCLYNANVNILLYIILGGYMYTTPCLYNANVNILLYIILGGYMYTTPCLYNASEHEGDIAKLETPVFEVKASAPMKAGFYYHMNGENIGTFKVHVNEHRNTIQSTMAFSIAGSQSDEWYYSCVNLPDDDVMVSLTFTAVLGDGCDSVIALDDVDISEGSCAGKTTLFFCRWSSYHVKQPIGDRLKIGIILPLV